MLDRMLFCLPKEMHEEDALRQCLLSHPEVRFVSLCGMDIMGDDTDEKIPIENMLADIPGFLTQGVQTDGSSVFLPEIARLNDARVDILPDLTANWYVDHNFNYLDEKTGLPVGTLRIPSYLVHNGRVQIGSRIILEDAVKVFKEELLTLLRQHPYVFDHLPLASVDDIDHLELTAATELEFYVKTPAEAADREQLHSSQELKEQYWKRTVGPVRTALEYTLNLLNRYGFRMEMGHKEVGGVKPKPVGGGDFGHIMEQLEINWAYSDPMQTADNDKQIRYIVKDVFRNHGLDVTFMAKPVEGVAGSGKHVHLGVVACLRDGSRVNLFTAKDQAADFLSPLGYGCLMGLLKNYDIIAPMANCTNDAYNRLKPGFEAPVAVVTSLGQDLETPSRNRTVLVGLIRDMKNPLATHFELRSPNPKANTYLVITAALMAMLDGARAALENRKDPGDLLASISKPYGRDDFYLEKNRLYRTEKNTFEDYTREERDKLFGRVAETVWEAVKGMEQCPTKVELLYTRGVMEPIDLASFRAAALYQWETELRERLIPGMRDVLRTCSKRHDSLDCADIDEVRWRKIRRMRKDLTQDTTEHTCLFTRLLLALEEANYDTASDLQLLAQQKIRELQSLYTLYRRNLL